MIIENKKVTIDIERSHESSVKYKNKNHSHDTPLSRATKNASFEIGQKIKLYLANASGDWDQKKFAERVKSEFEFDCTGQINGYLNGVSAMPIVIVLAFLEIFPNITFEELLNYEPNSTSNGSTQQQQQPLEDIVFSFLKESKILCGESNCTVDSRKMDVLFPDNGNILKLNFAHLPLKAKIEDDNGVEIPLLFQRGTLIFTREADKKGICRISGKLDIDTRGGRNAKLEGIAIILDLNSDHESCWCFLKRKSNPTILWAVCFSLKEIRGGDRWKTPRIAYTLNLRTYESLPLTHRLIFWRTDHRLLSGVELTDNEIKYLLGFTRLNTKYVRINSDDWNLLKDYFSLIKQGGNPTDSKYSELINHFKDCNINAVIGVFDDIVAKEETHFTFSYGDDSNMGHPGAKLPHEKLLTRVPLLVSWLRNVAQQQNYNKLRPEVNEDIAEMFEEIIKQRSSKNQESLP